MSDKPQEGSGRVDGRQGNNDQSSEPLYEISSSARKPRTRRAGVKVRARAARKAQRLALEEEERKASERAQAEAEAVGNAIRSNGMQNTLHRQSDAPDDMEERTTEAVFDKILGTDEMQNVVRQDKAKPPVAEDMKSSVENSYLADLVGLTFERAPESDHSTDAELDLDAWGGAFAECVCEMICVCHGPHCRCVGGCICV